MSTTPIAMLLAIARYMLVLSLFVNTNGYAAVNKWVDKNNQVHYSDQPPPADAKNLTPSKSKAQVSNTEDTGGNDAAAPSSAAAAPKTLAEREAELRKAQKDKQEAAEKAAQKQAEADAKKKNCEAAQLNLRNLESGRRMAETDASGEQVYLSDADRQQRTTEAQKNVDNFCK